MNDEIYFNGARFIPFMKAVERMGMESDEVLRLCESGKAETRQIGTMQYVNEESLRKCVFESEKVGDRGQGAGSREEKLSPQKSHSTDGGLPKSRIEEQQKSAGGQDIGHPMSNMDDGNKSGEEEVDPEARRKSAVIHTMPSVALHAEEGDQVGVRGQEIGAREERVQEHQYARGAHVQGVQSEHRQKELAKPVPKVVQKRRMEKKGSPMQRQAKSATASVGKTALSALSVGVAIILGFGVMTFAYSQAGNIVAGAQGIVTGVTRAFSGTTDVFDQVASAFGGLFSHTEVYLGNQQANARLAVNHIDESEPRPAEESIEEVNEPEPIQPTVVNQPVIERVIETNTVQTVSGVSQAQLQALEQSFSERLAAVSASIPSFSGPAGTTVPTFHSFAQSNKIDKLTNVTINSSTVSGISGITDADIPDTLTASNYLLLSGGTLTGSTTLNAPLTVNGAFTGTDLTLSGDLTVQGAQSLAGGLTVPYITATSTNTASTFSYGVGIGTTTPIAALDVNGNLIISGSGRYLNFGFATSSSGYGLRDNSGTLQFKHSAGTWTDVTAGITGTEGYAVTFDATDAQVATSSLFFAGGGDIGIGTTSPASKLDVWGSLTIGTSSTPALYVNTANERVGIGTTSPNHALTVSGDINFTGKLREDGNEVFASMIAPFAGACPTGWTEYTAARGRTVVGTPSGGTNEGTVGTALGNLANRTITDVPSHLHTVDPPSTNTNTTGAHSHRYTTRGDAGSGDGLSAKTHTDNNARTTTDGNHAHTLNIPQFNSGSTGVASVDVTMPYIQLTYCEKTAGADLAEWIPATGDIEPAHIVSVDPNNRERVVASTEAYDSAAIGIVATQPGWILGQEREGSVQMALAGRVPVRITLKNGEIRPGDPITTSSIPGVGMKATKNGPIIGRAMEAINETSATVSCTDPETGRSDQCAEALVFVNIGWHEPGEAEEGATGITYGTSNPLSVGYEFETGHIAAFSYDHPPAQSGGEPTKKGYLMLAGDNDFAVGVISREIGGTGELMRRERANNRVESEIRLVTSGEALVKMAPTSDHVHVGDAIIVSADHPGMGARATRAGFAFARALEEWEPGSGRNTISVMIGQTWFDPMFHGPDDHDHGHKVGYGDSGFLSELFARIIKWFADSANGIGEVFVNALQAREKICVDGECLTKEDIRSLKQVAGAHGDAVSSGTSQVTEDSDEQENGDAVTTDSQNSLQVTITGNNPARVKVGATYNDLGAKAKDADGEDLSVHTFVDGEEVEQIEIDTSTTTEYTITYKAVDTNGNEAEATRTVIVYEEESVKEAEVVVADDDSDETEDESIEITATSTATSTDGTI